MAHFIDRWKADDTFMALVRTAVTDAAAARRVRAVLVTQVMPTIAALSQDPAHVATRAGLVASQILGFALCRYVLQRPPVVSMSRAQTVRWLGPTLEIDAAQLCRTRPHVHVDHSPDRW